MMNKICRMALPLVVFPGLAFAQAAGTPPNGRLLASNCFQCHGTDGKAVSGFEKLSGMSATELKSELAEMKLKTGGGIMNAHAAAYTDAQVAAIAAYFAGVKNSTTTSTTPKTTTPATPSTTTTPTTTTKTTTTKTTTTKTTTTKKTSTEKGEKK